MTTYMYTGDLTDVGVNALGALMPRLTVRPEAEAFGPNGLVSDHRVPVTLSGTSFSMRLIPSQELVAAGRPGVKYLLELNLFALAADGKETQVWHTEWRFTAVAGGGEIRDMGDVPPIGFYVGPPWPTTHAPGGYYDQVTGDLGYYAIEVG